MFFCIAEEEDKKFICVCVGTDNDISRIKLFENNPTLDFPRLIGRNFKRRFSVPYYHIYGPGIALLAAILSARLIYRVHSAIHILKFTGKK